MNQTKIKRWHLERLAFVYLRQSSPTQVKKNVESAERQRRMQQRAQELGWPDQQVHLLGGDTGQSGSSLHGREDYQSMLQAVIEQQAGIICVRELSRLVRDNQDWNQLVRLCRHQGVLLADEYRVYDPADPQDRVVLGIQGAFSEFELAMICDRMLKSRAQKAERGELYEGFPSGYICRHAPFMKSILTRASNAPWNRSSMNSSTLPVSARCIKVFWKSTFNFQLFHMAEIGERFNGSLPTTTSCWKCSAIRRMPASTRADAVRPSRCWTKMATLQRNEHAFPEKDGTCFWKTTTSRTSLGQPGRGTLPRFLGTHQ